MELLVDNLGQPMTEIARLLHKPMDVAIRKHAALTDIDERFKGAVLVVCQHSTNQFKALGELRAVIEDLELSAIMLTDHNWTHKSISKIKHLEMVWYLHCNLAYKLREKIKLYFNSQKQCALALRMEQTDWLRDELKIVDREIGETIRDRGNTTHGWDEKEESIYLFGLQYLVDISKDPEIQERFGTTFESASQNVFDKAKRSCEISRGILDRILLEHTPTTQETLEYASRILDALKLPLEEET